MSWSETHRRWTALQEIEALADAGSTELPWNDEYAAIFGDRDSLAALLRYRWNLSRTAQLDTHLAEPVLEEHTERLVRRHAGVLRILRQYERRAAVPA